MAINFDYNYPQVAREAGFKLRQYKDGPIDWRILGSIEIERLLQDQRIEQVDSLLAHLSEAPLATILDTNILDSGIAKYFVVSQFAIQYLLFCRKFLDETIRELREAHAESQMDVAKLRKSLTEANNEILQLHKKITQIEAIHEVVYPCHLCTKSFISNDALNIHISRRHGMRTTNNVAVLGRTNNSNDAGISERHTETSTGTKEREHNDLQLINAIKLELEIKQLKERLNNAERDIRERNMTTSNSSRRGTPREPTKTVKSIAIQSELLEIKEQDDGADATLNSASTDSSEMRERKAQLNKLQTKIQEFEAWRQMQQTNNEESIAEINRKLGEIVHTLEETKTAPTMTPVTATVEPKVEEERIDAATLSRHGSPSVEDLERLLTQKVVEIGQKSAEKLEEFVHNMEANYKEKLDELEREIKKRNAAELRLVSEKKASVDAADETKDAETKTSTRAASIVETNLPPRDITYTAFNPTDSDSSLSIEPKPEAAKRMPRIRRSINVVSEVVAPDRAKHTDETYLIMDEEIRPAATAVKPKPRVRKIRSVETALPDKKHMQGEELCSLSAESNRTFVKPENADLVLDDKVENDSTDIAESLSSESEESSSKTELTPTLQKPANVKEKKKVEAAKNPKEPPKPKLFTRNDAQRMVNKRLIAAGLEPKALAISTAAMKRMNSELVEKRQKLKQKYPNFYVTRNKIKKLVDKLCSTKLPEPVKDMLMHTKPIKPKTTYNVARQKRDDVQVSTELESFETLELTSTPIQTTQTMREKDEFKQRLERILASPMRQPIDDDMNIANQQVATAQIHAAPPVPLTRKRVMFNTLSQNT
ncbi:cilium assembly protein DZIP1L [Bactrocera neohumeralis]|uniref:cilium assembly protein DZIP1L n=1 Tax=Bactrocera neohumeralis TaxID=98809 RepID=UPI0021661C2E|nr:cilium assembly protein DZIP1L [Bactrocera neohumeralis]